MTMPFTLLASGVGIGAPAPGWQPIDVQQLLILVGVTGVGKSTTLRALRDIGLSYHLLPDRRLLTDRIIIPAQQVQAGEAIAPVKDRKARFTYTRAYRQRHPGGMAYALAQLQIDPNVLHGLLIFDGLRGENEVTYAAQLLPVARFVILEAPDVVRVVRLMGRNDPFDQISARARIHAGHLLQSFEELDMAEAASLFSPLEQHALLDMVHAGEVDMDDLRTSVAIVVEERRNYDPAATRAALEQVAAGRVHVVDTVREGPQEVAYTILDFLRRDR